MKAIMITFDSLNRRLLPNYGCKEVIAPEFERLKQRFTRFDCCYAASLPCIPARRELHTGRENFLHCRWAALEPFDDSMPEILKYNGIHTHLATDHTHYWEDEGFGYHTRYSTFQFSRGQEGDPVYGKADTLSLEEEMKDRRVPHLRVQDAINRQNAQETAGFPQTVTFDQGLEFLRENHDSPNWFLHIETFDPHEPFHTPEEFRCLYHLPRSEGQAFDWPDYRRTDGLFQEQIDGYRRENMALVSFCSWNLGRILDAMDTYGLWQDTMVVINTDHGFFLGEHGWLGKNTGPYYNEVANIPLFLYDPRDTVHIKESRDLIQTVDLPATLLDFFHIKLPENMTGRPIRNGKREEPRKIACFGLFGGQINCTDGRFVYMRAPQKPGFPDAYTMAGQHFMRRRVQSGKDPYTLTLSRPFSFSKGYPLIRIGNMGNDFQTAQREYGNLLFDLKQDPEQNHPIHSPETEIRMKQSIAEWMAKMDAPEELFDYYGLEIAQN